MEPADSSVWDVPALLYGTRAGVRGQVTKLTRKALATGSWAAALAGCKTINLRDSEITVTMNTNQIMFAFDEEVVFHSIPKGISEACTNTDGDDYMRLFVQGVDLLWLVAGFVADPHDPGLFNASDKWARFRAFYPIVMRAAIRWGDELEWLEKRSDRPEENRPSKPWTDAFVAWAGRMNLDNRIIENWKQLDNRGRVVAVSEWLKNERG